MLYIYLFIMYIFKLQNRFIPVIGKDFLAICMK